MHRLIRLIAVLSLLSIGVVATTGCDKKSGGSGEEGEHAVVESGTYTGTIKEVKPEEKEIYVDADGNELELYFIDKTELTRNGEKATFSALEKGQNVEVKVKKVGKRLDPLAVKILE